MTGIDRIDGRAQLVLKMTPREGDVDVLRLDQETGLPTCLDVKESFQEEKMRISASHTTCGCLDRDQELACELR